MSKFITGDKIRQSDMKLSTAYQIIVQQKALTTITTITTTRTTIIIIIQIQQQEIKIIS